MAIDHPQVPVCCLSNGYMLGSFPFICLPKFFLCVSMSYEHKVHFLRI